MYFLTNENVGHSQTMKTQKSLVVHKQPYPTYILSHKNGIGKSGNRKRRKKERKGAGKRKKVEGKDQRRLHATGNKIDQLGAAKPRRHNPRHHLPAR